MIGFFIIIIFITISTAVFLVSGFKFALCILALCFLLSIIIGLNFREKVGFFKALLFFIITVFFSNLIFTTLLESLLVCLKIFTVGFVCLLISSIANTTLIAKGIAILCYPLKIFKVNPAEIYIIVVVSLNFIKILKNDFVNIKKCLQGRGVSFSLKHLVPSYILLFKIYFKNLFSRINELQRVLVSKGY